ncbi:mechanosensitive ion channel family protein [Streptomyces coryli]|uniref:mechanosensitive ion channel family protein n=1 Tax=Streptomyces coryli TaxID=1128680 RepID=UPI0019CFE0EA|nr:mechanosensitive ion channel family protein [Streptomyces coryli]
MSASDPTDTGKKLDAAEQKASGVADWFGANWESWLNNGLKIILIIVIAVVLRSVVRRLLTRFIQRMNRTAEAMDDTALGGLLVNNERRRQRTEAIGSVLRSVATFVIMGTAALMVLGAFGISLAPLLASAGVAGVALGFGARNLVTDFLSGVFMILEDQYGVGDEIDAGVATGTVVEVGLRVTKLRGPNGAIWYIRNGEVKRIGNLSQGWSTAAVSVRLGYEEDLERAQEIIETVGQDLAKASPWDEQLWGPVEVLGLDEVLLDSVVVQVSAKTMPGKSLGIERELRWRIKKALDAAGIRILGGALEPAVTDEDDPSAAIAAPSALANPASPQGVAASPLAPPAPRK